VPEWNAFLVSTIEDFFFANHTRMIDATTKHRLPAVFLLRRRSG
jgi:hypothetical protein